MDRFNAVADRYLSVLRSNENISAGLVVALIIYAAVIAPRLPYSIARIFDMPLVKFLLLFAIAYSAKYNATVAIIAAIGVMVTLNTLAKHRIGQSLIGLVSAGKSGVSSVASGVISGVTDVTGGVVRGTGAVLGGVVGGTSAVVGGVAHGVSDVAGGVRDATSAALGSGNEVDWHDSFYPQYVNMKPDAYMSRYSGNAAEGYDPAADYATLN